MKKNLILFTVLLFAATSSNAQAYTSWGDKISIGHSWTLGNNPTGSSRNFHPSVQVGRNAVFNINDNVGVGFGTFFSTEGSSYKLSTNDKWEHRANYIRVPIFASFNLGDVNRKIRPRIAVGPSVGFLVGGKTFILDNNDAFVGAKTVKAMHTKIDAGVNATLGWNIRLKDGIWFNHDFNYYHGLVKQTPNTAVSLNNAVYTNRNLSMSMGFLISSQAMKKWKSKMHDGDGKWRHKRNMR